MSKLSAKDKKLQDSWYKKLSKEGFVDIERDEFGLKRWDSMHFIARHTNFKGHGRHVEGGYSTLNFESRQEYYQLAGAFLYEHAFKDAKEKRIWELHSGGMPAIAIMRLLRKENIKTSKNGVHSTIKRLAEVMVKQCQHNRT